jgi:hypothetical protein
MAKVQVADVLVPTLFEDYVIERSTVLTDFGASDIVERSPQFDAIISDGGSVVNMPAWQGSALSGQTRQIISDTNAGVPNKITTATDKARISNDFNCWSVTLLATLLAGDDAMMAIGEMVSQYWAEIDQSIIINSVKGMLGAASFATNVLSILTEDGNNAAAANKLTGTTFIDALQKLGDAAARLTAIAIHSATQAALKKLDLIDYIPDSEGKANIEVFQGRRVITVDSMPSRAGTTSGTVYTSVLFGPAAFGFGNQNLSGDPLVGGFGSRGVEVARVPLNHDDILINRRRWIKHPRGMAWQDVTIAENGGPDDTELQEQAQWIRVWQSKNVRIVGIVHNN